MKRVRTVFFMRHAKSSWKESGLTDEERPLNRRGRADAPEMGKRLKAGGCQIDLIITSTAVRAVMTAKRVAKAMGFSGKIVKEPNLYLADIESYLKTLSGLGEDVTSVMILSHNPGTEQVVKYLSGQYLRMPTAAYAKLSFKGDWPPDKGSCNIMVYDFPKSERSI
jgi:phosphohistidine phosphatase